MEVTSIVYPVDTQILDRFWAKVSREGECWEWQASRTKEGYGLFWVVDANIKAHRYSWFLANGPIPAGLFICHSCDNPRCVRPEHLWVGSNLENNLDAIRKGRLVPRPTPRPGESHHAAKLTESDVKQIRSLCNAGEMTQREIAKRFRVDPSTVSEIKTRRKWRHVA